MLPEAIAAASGPVAIGVGKASASAGTAPPALESMPHESSRRPASRPCRCLQPLGPDDSRLLADLDRPSRALPPFRRPRPEVGTRDRNVGAAGCGSRQQPRP